MRSRLAFFKNRLSSQDIPNENHSRNDIEVPIRQKKHEVRVCLSAPPQMVNSSSWHSNRQQVSRTRCGPVLTASHSTRKTLASFSTLVAVSEWMLLYCLEWACIPVGKMTIPDCGPAVRSIQMKIAAEKKKSACLSQAKHLLSILMGINGRAGTGDRGVDWLAGPALTQPPLSILPALLFTANTSCCAPLAHSAPADVYICVCWGAI